VHHEISGLQVRERGEGAAWATTRLAPPPEERVPADDRQAPVGINEILLDLASYRVEPGRQARVHPWRLPHLAVYLPESVDRPLRLPGRGTGDEDGETVVYQSVEPPSRLPQGVGEDRDRRGRDDLSSLAGSELDIRLRRLPVVELAHHSRDMIRYPLLRLLAPDLDALGQEPARRDGI
jgi:hypothetical protein